jgi:trimeric autotransporter adhesin
LYVRRFFAVCFRATPQQRLQLAPEKLLTRRGAFDLDTEETLCQTSAYMKSTMRIILIATALLSLEVGGTKMYAIAPPPGDFYPGGNTAIGQQAFLFLTSGQYNTTVGFLSQAGNATASFNTAVGAGALLSNTVEGNTAVGAGALLKNTTGIENTAIGESALFGSTDGDRNTAVGASALVSNVGGAFNVAAGFSALGENTAGASNVALGPQALAGNLTGSNNTAVGALAGINGTGDGNVYVGAGVIGVAGENNHTYVRNIKDTTVSGGNSDTVTIDLMTGLLGHLSSSSRYKENIKPMDAASELLYQLQPVTYCYKKEVDRTQSPAFGLIAEQVAEVNRALVTRNSKGQPENVHYEMVNAMLLNEFLKEHRTVLELKEQIAALTATVKEQSAQIQKVSADLETSRNARQMAQVR